METIACFIIEFTFDDDVANVAYLCRDAHDCTMIPWCTSLFAIVLLFHSITMVYVALQRGRLLENEAV